MKSITRDNGYSEEDIRLHDIKLNIVIYGKTTKENKEAHAKNIVSLIKKYHNTDLDLSLFDIRYSNRNSNGYDLSTIKLVPKSIEIREQLEESKLLYNLSNLGMRFPKGDKDYKECKVYPEDRSDLFWIESIRISQNVCHLLFRD